MAVNGPPPGVCPNCHYPRFPGEMCPCFGASPSVSDLSRACQRIADRMRRDRGRELLETARAIESIRCSRCGRGMIRFGTPLGDTLGMCRHLFELLQRYYGGKPAPYHWGYERLAGFRVEVVD